MSIKQIIQLIPFVLTFMAIWAAYQEDWNNVGISVMGAVLTTLVLGAWELVEWIARKIKRGRQ